MNPAHLHLMVNHLPIIGLPLSLVLLAFVMFRKTNESLLIGLGSVVLVGLLSIPAYLSGEAAEEMVEDLPGFSHELIEQHEETAEVAFVLILITTSIALLGFALVWWEQGAAKFVLLMSLLMGIVACVFTFRTAYFGGGIRHSEIHP